MTDGVVTHPCRTMTISTSCMMARCTDPAPTISMNDLAATSRRVGTTYHIVRISMCTSPAAATSRWPTSITSTICTGSIVMRSI